MEKSMSWKQASGMPQTLYQRREAVLCFTLPYGHIILAEKREACSLVQKTHTQLPRLKHTLHSAHSNLLREEDLKSVCKKSACLAHKNTWISSTKEFNTLLCLDMWIHLLRNSDRLNVSHEHFLWLCLDKPGALECSDRANQEVRNDAASQSDLSESLVSISACDKQVKVLGNNIQNKLRLVQDWRGKEREEMKKRGRGYVVKDCLESVNWQIFKSAIPLTWAQTLPRTVT